MSIAYLNTYLELKSSEELTPLVEQLERRGMYALHCEEIDEDQWSASLETSDEDEHCVPQSTIAAILDAIDGLNDSAQAKWEQCSSRELNIGIDSGVTPHAVEYALSTGTLQRMADAGLKLGITIYAVPEDTSNNDMFVEPQDSGSQDRRDDPA